MNFVNCNYIQRKITPKSLDVHPIDNALIIHCEAEVSIVDNDDLESNYSFEKTKAFDKIIRLKSFNKQTDVNALCQDVISHSEKLISPSQEKEVIELLNYLKNRKSAPTKTVMGADIETFRPKTANPLIPNLNSISNNSTNENLKNSFSNNNLNSLNNFLEIVDYQSFFTKIQLDFKEDDLIGKYFDDNEKLSITYINEYTELLYEDGAKKLKGAVMIFRLALENENLLNLTTDGTLFCAMSRILREEGRKNCDLCSVILAFFCCISFYKEFHTILTKYKIGASSFDLINYVFEKENYLLQPMKLNSEKTKKKNFDTTFKENSFLSEENENLDLVKQDNLINKKKLYLIQKKNNRLFLLLFTFLLNLSNDTKTEIKMINKGVLVLILNCLKRQIINQELQLILITFLQRLSIKWEMKNQLISYNIIPILYTILNNITSQVSFHSILINIILKLIFNLTFDQKCRTLMIKHKFIPKLIQIMIKDRFKNEKLFILNFYQFTLEKQYCNLFIITLPTCKNLLNLFVNRIMQIEENLNKEEFINEINVKNDCCFFEYACLLINLAEDKNCAQIICENGTLEKLFSKAVTEDFEKGFTYINVCYMKLIRNLSLHDHPYKMIFLEHIDLLVKLILNLSNNKISLDIMKLDNFSIIFVTQALDILSNLQKVDWMQLIKKYSLYDWIRKRIKIGEQYNDEIVLSCLALLGSCCTQETCAIYLIETDCIKLLIDFLTAKQEEDEIIMQILYIINIMTTYDSVCEYFVKNDQITVYLLDLLNDRNPEIRSICNCTLDLLAIKDQQLQSKLKEERFKLFNESWLEMVNSDNNLNQIKLESFDDNNSLNEDLNFLEDSFTSIENSSLLKQKILSFENLKENAMESSFEENSNQQEINLFDKKIKSSAIPTLISQINSEVNSKVFRKQRPQTAYKTRTKSAKPT